MHLPFEILLVKKLIIYAKKQSKENLFIVVAH